MTRSLLFIIFSIVFSSVTNAGLLKSIFRPSNSRADFPNQEKFIILTQPPGQLTTAAASQPLAAATTAAVSTCPAKVAAQQPQQQQQQQQQVQPQAATVAIQAAPQANTLTYIPASALQYPQLLNAPIASFAPAMSAIPLSTVLANPSSLSQVFSSSPIFSTL